MKASLLAALLPGSTMRGNDIEIGGIKPDSRAIKPGDAFIALKGSVSDGHLFIQNALNKGASVIICNKGAFREDMAVTAIEVPDTTHALREILPLLYPGARKISLIGITGTSGKTSTTYLLESILLRAGRTPGVIGTIESRYKGLRMESSVTTPGPLNLFEMLEVMHTSGVDTCIMEVSSHALDQGRIDGLSYDYAVFMNLSLDHLDYHKDMHAYFSAKKRLFMEYLKGRAIINYDDMFGRDLIGELNAPITFGQTERAMVKALKVQADLGGIRMELGTPGGTMQITSPLLGSFQAYNIMASVGVCLAMEIDRDTIERGIQALQGIPGRMDPVENPYGLKIIVDYAHKPEALEKALQSARGLARGRIITIFGCGGDRDRSKRSVMGSISERLSDITIVTSDNPRSEDPLAIIDEITSGIQDRTNLFVEPERAKAIMLGIKIIRNDDCLIIAGKGHETYQIIGDKRIPFDDKVCVQECLREVFGR